MLIISAFADEISKDLDEQLNVLESEGYSYLELRSVWGKSALSLSEDELSLLKKILVERGFKVSSIGSPIGKIKITDDFDKHMIDFKKAIDVAKYLGAPFIRIFSFYMPLNEDPAVYRNEVLSRMKQIVSLAQKENIQLVHENEKHIYGDTGERCLDIIKECNSPFLGCAFDPANFIQCGVAPMTEAYSLLTPYIHYIHIKDAMKESGIVVPAGEGDGELKELFNALKEREFSGFMSIEPHLGMALEHKNLSGPEKFVIASKALKKLLKEANMDWT